MNFYRSVEKSSLDIGSRITAKNNVLTDYCYYKHRIKQNFFIKNKIKIIEDCGKGKDYRSIIFDTFMKQNPDDMTKHEVLSFAKYNFEKYLTDDKLENKGNLCISDDEYILTRINNKYCEHYTNKIIRRMNWVCHKYRNVDCVMLTLTLDPKKYRSLIHMWTSIKDEQHKFLTKLSYHLKKQGKKLPDFIATIECQHGEWSWLHPHIHIVFINAKRIMDWRIISKIWGNGYTWINRTKDNKKIRKPIDYITKYITKTYTDKSEMNINDQAIQWLFKIRSFSYSKGLIFPLNYTKNDLIKLFFIETDNSYSLDWFDLKKERIMEYYYDKS